MNKADRHRHPQIGRDIRKAYKGRKVSRQAYPIEVMQVQPLSVRHRQEASGTFRRQRRMEVGTSALRQVQPSKQDIRRRQK